jgi:hypothetical protein
MASEAARRFLRNPNLALSRKVEGGERAAKGADQGKGQLTQMARESDLPRGRAHYCRYNFCRMDFDLGRELISAQP